MTKKPHPHNEENPIRLLTSDEVDKILRELAAIIEKEKKDKEGGTDG